MLKQTFLHLSKIGPATEVAFWQQGLTTWEAFLAAPRVRGVSDARRHALGRELEESLAHLDRPAYFGRRLPPAELWRLYQPYRPRAAFLDIETTGMAWPHLTVTVVGLYDGRDFQQFILGDNLQDFPAAVANYELLVTFNGAQFDLPVLRAFFPRLRLPAVHIDLRFVWARLGYKGGLKRIEPQLGVHRPPDLEGLDGFDAVLLWQRAQRGDAKALQTLCRYNREDVINLEFLMDEAYRLSWERLRPFLAQKPFAKAR